MTEIRLPDEMCAEDAVAIFNVMAERDSYRAALQVIAEQGTGADQRLALAALAGKQAR